jgi:hypothetical protein
MLTAKEVELFLRQFEPLQSVVVEEQSKIVAAPWLVRLHGVVSIHGEIHAFETDLNLLEFGGSQDLVKLAQQILKSFETAERGRAL